MIVFSVFHNCADIGSMSYSNDRSTGPVGIVDTPLLLLKNPLNDVSYACPGFLVTLILLLKTALTIVITLLLNLNTLHSRCIPYLPTPSSEDMLIWFCSEISWATHIRPFHGKHQIQSLSKNVDIISEHVRLVSTLLLFRGETCQI